MNPPESTPDEPASPEDELHPIDRLMQALGEVPYDPSEGEILFVSYADGPVPGSDHVIELERASRRARLALAFVVLASLDFPRPEDVPDDQDLLLDVSDFKVPYPGPAPMRDPVILLDRRPRAEYGMPPRKLGPARSQVNERPLIRRTPPVR